MVSAALVLASVAAAGSAVADAERSAADALRLLATAPRQAVAQALRAEALTRDFVPTSFVRAGRRGEVVEDAFQAARLEYRSHRSRVYEALGAALLAAGERAGGRRVLGRAVLLEPAPARVGRLARALIAEGRGAEALELLHRHAGVGGLGAESVAVLTEAVDAAGRGSVQAELDRSRIRALSSVKAEIREGPVKLPVGTRLSTGGPLRLEEGLAVLYLAEASCRTCSEDLQALKEAVPARARVVMVPSDPDDDHALRQVMQLYRYDWPVLLGRGLAAALGVESGTVLVVGRRGWVAVGVRPPFVPGVATVMSVLSRTDVQETVPRPGARLTSAAAPRAIPGLLPEGLAPGEDEPAPPEFDRAVAAYRARRFADALRLFDVLAAREDHWLLPQEARLDRALCLAGLGRRGEARQVLLRIGDSRFQEAVDRALERVGSGAR